MQRQQGQDVVAQPVAKVGGVQVGAVKARLQPVKGAIGQDLSARDFEQGADEVQRWDREFRTSGIRRGGLKETVVGEGGTGQHAPQAGQTGSAEVVHQHRLSLVVGIVAHGDGARANGRSDPAQEGIARAAGRLLDGQAVLAGQRGYAGLLDGAGQLPIGGKGLNKFGVGVGLCPAQPMVQVGHVQGQVVLPAQATEGVQQTEGVGPSRHADHHGIARGHQVVLFNCLTDLIQHFGHLPLPCGPTLAHGIIP